MDSSDASGPVEVVVEGDKVSAGRPENEKCHRRSRTPPWTSRLEATAPPSCTKSATTSSIVRGCRGRTTILSPSRDHSRTSPSGLGRLPNLSRDDRRVPLRYFCPAWHVQFHIERHVLKDRPVHPVSRSDFVVGILTGFAHPGPRWSIECGPRC